MLLLLALNPFLFPESLKLQLFMGCLVLELVLALGAAFHYALYISILQPIEPISLTPKPD